MSVAVIAVQQPEGSSRIETGKVSAMPWHGADRWTVEDELVELRVIQTPPQG